MIFLYAAISFVFGVTIGSFLNVVIFRLNTKRSLRGRSACMACRHKLAWYELIPLLSFLGLKGRCRSCKTKISIQYPLVELAAGAIFAVLFLKLENTFFVSLPLFSAVYIYYAFLFSVLLVIGVYDLKHKIIPDRLALIFGLFAFAGLFFFENYGGGFFGFNFHVPTIIELLSGVIISMPFAVLWFFSSGRWMGFGDAKLGLGIGWMLGVFSAFFGLVIAFWSGAIVGIVLVILSKSKGTNRFKMKSEIPFAPFMIFGTFLAFIFDLSISIF